MATEAATAKDGQFVLVSILPDVCLTPDNSDKPHQAQPLSIKPTPLFP